MKGQERRRDLYEASSTTPELRMSLEVTQEGDRAASRFDKKASLLMVKLLRVCADFVSSLHPKCEMNVMGHYQWDRPDIPAIFVFFVSRRLKSK